MIEYKYLDENTIQWREQLDAITYKTGNIIKGQTRTRINEQGEEETYNPWDELMASGVTIQEKELQPVVDNAIAEINRQRDALIHGGIDFNGHTFQTDDKSMADVMGAILAEMDTQWLTADNGVVPMTVADLKALGQAIAAHKASYVYQARTHKDNVLAMTSAQDVEAYMNTLGWS